MEQTQHGAVKVYNTPSINLINPPLPYHHAKIHQNKFVVNNDLVQGDLGAPRKQQNNEA